MKRFGMQKRAGEPGTHTGQLVEELDSPTDTRGPLYLRLSMGDYLIECSGSKISETELRKKVDAFVTLRGEIRAGEPRGLSGNGDYLLATELVD